MKIALCFIINYEHILNKEQIWREWIEPNKDIINVYFYYGNLEKIKSNWIRQHAIPENYIFDTSYYHVIPAYISIMNYAMNRDSQNKWFCLLTDSCCPIISPKRFRYLFYENYNKSLFSWKPAWWNPFFHKRGNLTKLPKELWLGHDPWFILTLVNVKQIMHFIETQPRLFHTICSGGLANETLFAVIFKTYGELENKAKKRIRCVSTHIADWSRMSSTTSPHIFKDASEEDKKFINTELELERNSCIMFIRKIAPTYPDENLLHYIYTYNKEKDDMLVLREPFEMKLNRYMCIFREYSNILWYILPIFLAYFLMQFIKT
jgi:Core-2/I-Branching enzyme